MGTLIGAPNAGMKGFVVLDSPIPAKKKRLSLHVVQ
jgi:hypothetical protein